MTKTFLSFLLLFVVLVLAQVTIFNHIWLFGMAMPLVFIYFIISLPVATPTNWMLTLGFITGLTVDIFSNTAGLNALSCTILAGLRHPVLRLYMPREEDMTNPVPSMRSVGTATYTKYMLTMTVIYCIVYFVIDSAGFFNIGTMALRILASSILTFMLLLATASITSWNSGIRK